MRDFSKKVIFQAFKRKLLPIHVKIPLGTWMYAKYYYLFFLKITDF